MTVLELLARAAGTGLVAPHPGVRILDRGIAPADGGPHLIALRRAAVLVGRGVGQRCLVTLVETGGARRAGRGRAGGNRRARHGPPGGGADDDRIAPVIADDAHLGLVGHLHLQVEQVADHLLHEGVHHRGEHLGALPLVLDQRIALRHRAQADALAQVVHLVEVLAPLAVQHGQQHPTLELTHGLGAELGLPGVVRLAGVGLEVLHQFGGGEVDPAVVRQFETDRVERTHLRPQRVQIPVLGEPGRGGLADVALDDLVGGGAQPLGDVGALQHLAAIAVDRVPLAVHHVVVAQHVLAHLEVLRLDLLLGLPDRLRDALVLDRLIVGDLQCLHHPVDDVGLEQPHQVVLEGQIEAGLPRITLPARTTTQLVVDPPRLVPFGAQHVEAPEGDDLLVLHLRLLLVLLQYLGVVGLILGGVLQRVDTTVLERLVGQELGVATEDDVGATTGHVGRDCDGALAARLRNDGRLTLVVLRVQHLVRHADLLEQRREHLGLGHRGGADQHRLALLMTLRHVGDDRPELRQLGAVDQVLLVLADQRPVRRDRQHRQAVDLLELRLLGLGRAGHPRQLVVHPEIVLQRDRRQGLVLVADLDPLLGLDRLVQALVVTPARERTAGVLVDDQDLAVQHDVVLVLLEQFLGPDGVVQVRDQRRVGRLVEVVDAELVLHPVDTGLEDRHGALLLVDLVVAVDGQLPGRQRREHRVPLPVLLGRTGDDQRRPRLVDQDRVDLVDDREMVAPLDAGVQGEGHVVAQVVEAELVVGPVGDVAAVGAAALLRIHVRQNGADRQTEPVVHPAHPLGIAPGEVVVHGDDMDTLAGQRVEVHRQGRDQRLALTGLHLGDAAPVQRRAALDLHVVVTLVHHPLGGLADGRERLGHDGVERLTVVEALSEVIGLAPQLGIVHRDEVRLDQVDLLRDGLEPAKDATFAHVQDLVQDCHGISAFSRERLGRPPGRRTFPIVGGRRESADPSSPAGVPVPASGHGGRHDRHHLGLVTLDPWVDPAGGGLGLIALQRGREAADDDAHALLVGDRVDLVGDGALLVDGQQLRPLAGLEDDLLVADGVADRNDVDLSVEHVRQSTDGLLGEDRPAGLGGQFLHALGLHRYSFVWWGFRSVGCGGRAGPGGSRRRVRLVP
ncbi:hypothetical protein SDC9_57580 [bioreactor metagenome]|uniref:NAD-specific glutamate dehydrogenase n=1 Tax=bioreactor metagenome TaxID=1076179 RepID=A0A644X602_9ZZZZ